MRKKLQILSVKCMKSVRNMKSVKCIEYLGTKKKTNK